MLVSEEPIIHTTKATMGTLMKKLRALLLTSIIFLFSGCFILTPIDYEVPISECYGTWTCTDMKFENIDLGVEANTYIIEITATDFIVYDNREGEYAGAEFYPYTEDSDGIVIPQGFGIEYHTFELKNDTELTIEGETILGSTRETYERYHGSLPPTSW